MNIWTKVLTSGAVILALPALTPARAADQSTPAGAPKTVRQLLSALGDPAAGKAQLRLKIAGETSGEEIGALPRKMDVEVLYDRRANRIRVEIDTVSGEGKQRKMTVYSDAIRAARWSTDGSGENLRVQALDPTLTLPNPWSLPPSLAFPGLFADWLQGYEALAREFSRSAPLNREPDSDGLLNFQLKPSSSAGVAMRNQIEAGLLVKAGFEADSGLLKVLSVAQEKPEAVLTMRLVEHAEELSAEQVASFGIPDAVMELIRNPPEPLVPEGENGGVEAPERLGPKKVQKETGRPKP